MFWERQCNFTHSKHSNFMRISDSWSELPLEESSYFSCCITIMLISISFLLYMDTVSRTQWHTVHLNWTLHLGLLSCQRGFLLLQYIITYICSYDNKICNVFFKHFKELLKLNLIFLILDLLKIVFYHQSFRTYGSHTVQLNYIKIAN